MARPIKETPILYGEAARKFEEETQRVENMTREERMANRKKVEEESTYQYFLYLYRQNGYGCPLTS